MSSMKFISLANARSSLDGSSSPLCLVALFNHYIIVISIANFNNLFPQLFSSPSYSYHYHLTSLQLKSPSNNTFLLFPIIWILLFSVYACNSSCSLLFQLFVLGETYANTIFCKLPFSVTICTLISVFPFPFSTFLH